jgi:mannose-6-phosphate isomerase-like protein (cupin superfamily)
MILKAGDVLFVPAGTVHSAANVGNSTASEPNGRRGPEVKKLGIHNG